MIVFVFLTATFFAIDNREFFETVAEQIDTHDWYKIHCRQVIPELPALTIETPSGKQLVCNKLKLVP
jgi:hypothetical protein|tara:strand:- start:558 stop:758 length:201 start_codon:yes stop_codon:yes gene_type:complete